MERLIGKYYLPYDNSYSVNITSISNYPYEHKPLYLAGTFNTEAKLCKIVSEPFICKINTINNDVTEMAMILVEYDNNTVSVMFHQSAVKGGKIMDNGVPLMWENDELL